MTVNYCKLNHVMTSAAVSVSDVVSLVGHINTYPGTWHVGSDLANDFFPVAIIKDHQSVSFQLARPTTPLHCPISFTC